MKKSKFVVVVFVVLLLAVVSVKPERAYGFDFLQGLADFMEGYNQWWDSLPEQEKLEMMHDAAEYWYEQSQQNQKNQFGQKKREWWEPSQPTLTSPYQPNQSLPYPLYQPNRSLPEPEKKEEKSWWWPF